VFFAVEVYTYILRVHLKGDGTMNQVQPRHKEWNTWAEAFFEALWEAPFKPVPQTAPEKPSAEEPPEPELVSA
jgi:hypothetical protein